MLDKEIKEILAGFHDDIIGIWETGQQNEDDYHERIDVYIENTFKDIMDKFNSFRKEIK